VAFDISEQCVHEPLNLKATEHCTSNTASCPRRWEYVSTSVALDDHSCLLPWMIMAFIALDDQNCLLASMITAFIALDDQTVYCLG